MKKRRLTAPRDPANPARGAKCLVSMFASRIIPLWVLKTRPVPTYFFVRPAIAEKTAYEPVWCAKLRHSSDQCLYDYARWVPLPTLCLDKSLRNDPETVYRATIRQDGGPAFYENYKRWLDCLKNPTIIPGLFPPLSAEDLAYQLEVDLVRLRRMTARIRDSRELAA